MEYVHVTPMQRAILEIYEPQIVENDIVKMIKAIYDDMPQRIYADDLTDEDYYSFGCFLMGIATALLATDNDKVSNLYRKECRVLQQNIAHVVKLIMIETDLD